MGRFMKAIVAGFWPALNIFGILAIAWLMYETVNNSGWAVPIIGALVFVLLALLLGNRKAVKRNSR